MTLSRADLLALEPAYLAVKARRDFRAFLGYVRIQEPPDPLSPLGGEPISFEIWPHLVEMAGDLLTEKKIVWVKARQVGATWLTAAYVCWFAMFRENSIISLFSKGEYEAALFLERVATIQRLLPDHIGAPLSRPKTAADMYWGNGSHIHAFPSTRDAGRSETASLVVQDEAEFHEYLADNFVAVKPTTDMGGQHIMLSTVNKRQMESLFKALVRAAPGNGWAMRFIPYFARPGRDEAWREEQKLNVPSALGISPELFIEQEYPGSLEEALSPSRAMAYFDPDVLQWMMANTVQEPIKEAGFLSVWKPAGVGRHYVMGVDTAWGKTGSYNVASVCEWETAEQVAEIHGRLHPNVMAYEVVELHKRYNHAFIGLERAGEGQERDGDSVVVVEKVVELLKDCSCRARLYYHDHESAEPKIPGWQTDSKSRPVILGEFREAVREQQFTIRSRGGIGEMMTFIQAENGRAEASKGAYDDRVMAYAIMWRMRKEARFSLAKSWRRVRVPRTW